LQLGYLRKLFEIESSEVKKKCVEKMLNYDVYTSEGCTEQYENVHIINTHVGNKKFVRNFWFFLGGT